MRERVEERGREREGEMSKCIPAWLLASLLIVSFSPATLICAIASSSLAFSSCVETQMHKGTAGPC